MVTNEYLLLRISASLKNHREFKKKSLLTIDTIFLTSFSFNSINRDTQVEYFIWIGQKIVILFKVILLILKFFTVSNILFALRIVCIRNQSLAYRP